MAACLLPLLQFPACATAPWHLSECRLLPRHRERQAWASDWGYGVVSSALQGLTAAACCTCSYLIKPQAQGQLRVRLRVARTIRAETTRCWRRSTSQLLAWAAMPPWRL